MEKIDRILSIIPDYVSDLLYYDRKEDEDIPVGFIEEAISSGDITTQEIIDGFSKELHRVLS